MSSWPISGGNDNGEEQPARCWRDELRLVVPVDYPNGSILHYNVYGRSEAGREEEDVEEDDDPVAWRDRTTTLSSEYLVGMNISSSHCPILLFPETTT